ncbi:MAG: YkgJ family cysteine cluster protein [Gammaproteobacteria bacterium]|nr:MAG: YkgJ family cysteine cluster protein [Gammaproteobacteria bacterium]
MTLAASPPPAQRLRFPEDERRLPWLGTLLEALHVTDQGVAEAVRRETAQGRRLACRKGCAHCCRTHVDIPVYPLELMGIAWYVAEKLQGPDRETLRTQLRRAEHLDACPFLVEDRCAIHPLRPQACRLFNVFDRPCGPGEDAWYTRRRDVLTPLDSYRRRATELMLPFYGVRGRHAVREALRTGAIHRLARSLRSCRWEALVARMEREDARVRS